MDYTNLICVANREQNLAHDSYFYATFYNPETDSFQEFEIGATAYAGGCYSYPITKDQAVLTKYRDMIDAALRKAERAVPRVGRTVIASNARKYKGEGRVLWVGKSQWGYNRMVARVQFENGVTEMDINRLTVVWKEAE